MFCLGNVTYLLDVTLTTHCHISTLSTLKFKDCRARPPPLPPLSPVVGVCLHLCSSGVYYLSEMLSLVVACFKRGSPYSLLQPNGARVLLSAALVYILLCVVMLVLQPQMSIEPVGMSRQLHSLEEEREEGGRIRGTGTQSHGHSAALTHVH